MFKELCLTIVPTIGNLVDREAMKSQLLPKILKMIMDSNVLSVRIVLSLIIFGILVFIFFIIMI